MLLGLNGLQGLVNNRSFGLFLLDFASGQFEVGGRRYATFGDVPGESSSGGANGTIVRDGQVVSATAPRIGDDGLVVGLAATNIYKHSCDLTASEWTANNVTITTSTEQFIDGVFAQKITPSTTDTFHRVYGQNQANLSGTVGMSYLGKADGYDQIAIREGGVSGAAAVFTLSGAGVVDGTRDAGAVTVSDAKIERLGDTDIYRVSAIFTGAVGMRLGVVVLDGNWTSGDPLIGDNTFAGDGTSGVLVSGTQVEADRVSSVIVTTTAAVTRTADSVTISGNDAGASFAATYSDGSTGTLTADGSGVLTIPANALAYDTIKID